VKKNEKCQVPSGGGDFLTHTVHLIIVSSF